MDQQLQHKLTSKEIGELKAKVIGILDYVHTRQTRILTEDRRQLTNHLQYVLTTLTNMDNVLLVEKSDPYSSYRGDYSSGASTPARTVVYNPDGTTRVVQASSVHTTGDGWEHQFDQGLLQKPPCFIMPPQQLTNIPKIQRAGDWDRVQRL